MCECPLSFFHRAFYNNLDMYGKAPKDYETTRRPTVSSEDDGDGAKKGNAGVV
jgi:hypothetical protein